MKIFSLVALAAVLFCSQADALAQNSKHYVFLCFGQSNMEGSPPLVDQDRDWTDARFQMMATTDYPKLGRTTGKWYPASPPLSTPGAGIGPSDYFGRTLVAKLPKDVEVRVVVVAVGGCQIELFDKDRYQENLAKGPDWLRNKTHAYGGNPYGRLVEMAKLAQKDGVIKGILLHQGESNNGDRAWPDKVNTVYRNLLQDLNLKAENVPLLAGELMSSEQNGLCAGMNGIIGTLPKTIPTAHVVSSQGCAGKPDRLHFTPEGYRELGKHYAEVMLPLLGYGSSAKDLKTPQSK
jgi:alpha-L-fucosidase 2